MKKIIACLLALVISVAFVACQGTTINSYQYDTTGFQAADGDVTATEAIGAVNVNWVAGKVYVVSGTQDAVTVRETGVGKSAKIPLYFHVADGVLYIAFAENGTDCRSISKNLTVSIPQNKPVADLSIDCVAASVYVENVVTDKLDVSSVSGRVECGLDRLKEATVETTSGGVNLRLSSVTSAKVESVSGSLNLNIGALESLQAESTSGNVSLALPKTASFTMTAESTSGKISTGDFSCTISGNRYIASTGKSLIKLRTNSGDITLKAA